MLFKRYYFVKHNDRAMSGVACLVTIAKQYGLRLSVLSLRETSFTDKNGVGILGLIGAASKLKLSAKGVQCQPGEPISNIPFPVIARITKEDYSMFYVVIHKAEKDKFNNPLITKGSEGVLG